MRATVHKRRRKLYLRLHVWILLRGWWTIMHGLVGENWSLVWKGSENAYTYSSVLLVRIDDKISQVFNNDEFSKEILFDLAKAVDTVSHLILLSKLEHSGIRGAPLEWFKSYLSDRRQQVNCNGMQFIQSGVPQGPILGHLLVLLYFVTLRGVSRRGIVFDANARAL